ncbi:thiopeptide-type bacteriocin biosynthesis protein [Altericista sp. CCNU0014]|uniref:thiopeptide-type bacteriocin biosynthesis protein n=1 Tax=Altericista sp. CCNU0014 TaxID=3082949 RepID=UPI003850D9A3
METLEQNWQWLQLNVGLMRYQNQARFSARKLFAEIDLLTQQWREDGLLQCFFFMRKPPDVRLRFFTNQRQMVIQQLTDLMDELVRQNTIRLSFFSEYEPEGDRFGGLASLARVHDYFDIDTAQWLRLDRRKQPSDPAIGDAALLSAILHDLFQSTLSDPDRVLNAWQTLGQLFGTAQPSMQSLVLPLVPLQVLQKSVGLDTALGQILDCYLSANAELSQQLKELYNTGQIHCDLPDLLANVGQFTLHRHGFDWQRAGPLIEGVVEALQSGRSPALDTQL